MLDMLPEVNGVAVLAVEAKLQKRDGPASRGRIKTARILVFLVMLNDQKLPLPPRDAVRKHLDVSLPMLDRVLSQSWVCRDIARIIAGKRLRDRRLIPARWLIDCVHHASP